MRTAILAAIVIIAVVVVGAAAAAATTAAIVYALAMIGQQFFPDGTGTAYFDDGTTESFIHTFTPANGYYYDDSTVFVYGQPPGYEGNQTILDINLQSAELGATGDIINVTISSGAEILGDRALQPSNIIKAKVGDAIVWTNEDYEAHNLMSPPQDYQSQTPAGGNWDFLLQPGQNGTLIVTRPVGMHFADVFNPDIKGAVIVEK